MNQSRRAWMAMVAGTSSLLLAGQASSRPAPAPKPYGALPSARQLAWQRLETYGFLHFTVNTFTDREWGLGDEDPKIFDPSDFSADQIVAAAKAGGLKQLIITAKHHDGFCLWPSVYTEHSVRNSGYKGDVVGEIAAACHAQGLKFGVYLSPWDRNHAEYGRPAYVTYYQNQLRELLTHYGPIHEVWFDGANGGDGYYGGAREVRHIYAATYYQWDKVRAIVRELAPQAVMFADEHMDVRWVGNERGVAGDPCWPTVDATPFTPEKGNRGVRGGDIWNPAEVDVSIRPGWFFHADENDRVRSPANLLRLYLYSVGRGTNLLLNLPPDRRGRIHETDASNLRAFRAILDQTYGHNLAQGARATASSRLSGAHDPAQVLVAGGFWAAREDDRDGAWLELDLPDVRRFDLVRLREVISYGARVDDFAVDAWLDGGWKTLAQHSCIADPRLIRLDTPVATSRVRLRIVKAAASPVISEFSLFLLPDVVEEPAIVRDPAGRVTITPATGGLDLFYTLDGSAPTAASSTYAGPFDLPGGGTVRAVARRTATGGISAVTTADFDVASGGWTLVSSNGDGAGLLSGKGFRGPDGQPAELVIDLGQAYDLKGFTLTPGSDFAESLATSLRAGPPAAYSLWVSGDGQAWGEPAISGEFSNIAANRAGQTVRFAAPHRGRYIRIVLPRAVQDKPVIAFASLGILTR